MVGPRPATRRATRQRANAGQASASVVEKRLKTASSARLLRLPKAFIDEIDRRGDLDSPYVCTRLRRPWVPDTITELWGAEREKLGLPHWTFHDLRHGAAGLLHASGCDLLEIAAVLGHRKPDMSWLYTSSSEEKAQERPKALDHSWGQATSSSDTTSLR